MSLVTGGAVVLCIAAAALMLGIASTSSASGAVSASGSAENSAAASAREAPSPESTNGSESGQGSELIDLTPDQIHPTAPPAPFVPPAGSPVGAAPRSGGNTGDGAGDTGGTSVNEPVTVGGQPIASAPETLNPSTLTVDQLNAEIDAAVSSHNNAAPLPGELTVKRSANEALPVVQLTGSPIVDSTDYLITNFGRDVDVFQTSTAVSMAKDTCLLDWARATLPTMNGAGKAYTTDVCGRTAAVIVGGSSVSGRDMILRALYNSSNSSLKGVVFGAPTLTYASVASNDGKAIMVVVARP